MKKFKEEKGITLVALIITIVVLLILAAVAIGAAKDSDIIGHAQNAASSFKEGKNNESVMLSSAEELLKELTSEDLTERLRSAIEKASFYNDLTDAEALLKEYKLSMEKREEWMYVANMDSVNNGIANPIYSIIGFGSKIYDYEVDTNEKKITVLESSHKDYATVQQFKKDIVEVRNTFLNKNIEDFEQEKIDDSHWKIKGVNIFGETEIIVKYFEGNDSGTLSSYLQIDYSEKCDLDLNPEIVFTVNGDKLCGKVVSVTQSA